MKWLWISNDNMTCTVDIDDNNKIVATPPILNRFLGQHKDNLINWMKFQLPETTIEEKYL
jgi:hypothetical protein